MRDHKCPWNDWTASIVIGIVAVTLIGILIRVNVDDARRKVDQQITADLQEQIITMREENLQLYEYVADLLETQIYILELLQQLYEQPVNFLPSPDVPLAPELQEHTYTVCAEWGVRYTLALAIMEHESGFLLFPPDNINTDGSRDRGLMQINECNWSWLQADHGLDVDLPEDNILSGILILSIFLERYPEEQALVAYQCGESRMIESGISSTQYSRWVLQRAAEYEEAI